MFIPKNIFDSAGLREGNFVEITQQAGTIIVRPKAVVDSEEVLTKEEEKVIESGFRELKRGRYIAWTEIRNELRL